MNTPIHFDGQAAFTALLAKHRSAQSALRAELASFKGQPVSDRSREIRAELPALAELIEDCLETLEELALEAAESDANCAPTGAVAKPTAPAPELCPYCGDPATRRKNLGPTSSPWCFSCDEPTTPRAKSAAPAPERAHLLRAALDINGEPHPFAGFACTVLKRFPTTQAGFDCIVALDCTATLEPYDLEGLELSEDGRPTFEACEREHLARVSSEIWELLKNPTD